MAKFRILPGFCFEMRLAFLILFFNLHAKNWNTLSESPRIYYQDDFITSKQCDLLISHAQPKLEASPVSNSSSSFLVKKKLKKVCGSFLVPF